MTSSAEDRRTSRPLRVALVALYSYPLFNPRATTVFGGSEVRAALFAKELAKHDDLQITVVVNQHDGPRREMFDRVQVCQHSYYLTRKLKFEDSLRARAQRAYVRMSRFPYVRPYSLDPRNWASLAAVTAIRGYRWARRKLPSTDAVSLLGEPIDPRKLQIYKSLDADVYCCLGNHEVSAELVQFCRSRGRPFMMICGSDYDLQEDYRANAPGRNIYGCRNAACYEVLAGADRIVVQTDSQRSLLVERFGRQSTLIANPIDLEDAVPCAPLAERNTVLWIGKSDHVKRPLLALELARRCPEIAFRLVCNRSHGDILEQVLRTAPPNVSVVERIPIDQIEQEFAQAFAFVSTSVFEGFPNTFLQAGKYGVPVVSLAVDPGQMLTRGGCGMFAGDDLDRLADGLRCLHTDLSLREQYGRTIRTYVETHHNLRSNVAQLANVLRESAAAHPAARGLPRPPDLQRRNVQRCAA